MAKAQINSNINGLKLGQTNLNEGIEILKSIDDDCLHYEINGIIDASANNFPFAGISWSSIIISFENNKLNRIQLNVENLAQENFNIIYEKLKNAYLSKYKEYLFFHSDTFFIDKDIYGYKEDKIDILLSFDKSECSISLTYTYKYKLEIGDGI